ncbi:MAG: hypothetical protein MUF53_07465, partial [Gemmatimonadaceae bacterium]|nr:hypothetical protein [Gemmatimonadaceae bacterium]
HPWTLHANAAAAFALEVFSRTLDEETAKEVADPATVRQAARKHFVRKAPGGEVFAVAGDLLGAHSDEPLVGASLGWLPQLEFCARTDAVYTRTMMPRGGRPATAVMRRSPVCSPTRSGTRPMRWGPARPAPRDRSDGRGTPAAVPVTPCPHPGLHATFRRVRE